MSIKFESSPVCCDDELIFEASEASRGFEGLADANRYFGELCSRVPEFISPANNVYRYKDYYINAGKRFILAGHSDGLMKLNRFKLSCLPEGIAQVWLDNDEDMVLFTRIEGSTGRRLIPCGTGVQLTEEARYSLLSDAERLMQENYALLSISENKDSWHLLEGENRVIMSDCRLAYVSDKAKAAYRSRIMKILSL